MYGDNYVDIVFYSDQQTFSEQYPGEAPGLGQDSQMESSHQAGGSGTGVQAQQPRQGRTHGQTARGGRDARPAKGRGGPPWQRQTVRTAA